MQTIDYRRNDNCICVLIFLFPSFSSTPLCFLHNLFYYFSSRSEEALDLYWVRVTRRIFQFKKGTVYFYKIKIALKYYFL
jgi:hypothetical protein